MYNRDPRTHVKPGPSSNFFWGEWEIGFLMAVDIEIKFVINHLEVE